MGRGGAYWLITFFCVWMKLMCGAIGRCCAGGDAISGEGDAMNLEYVLVVWFLYSAYSLCCIYRTLFVLHRLTG